MTWGFSSYETRIRWAAAAWAVLMTAWCMCPLPWLVRLIGALIWLTITVLASLSFAWWRPRSDRNVPIFLSIDAVEETPTTDETAKRTLRREALETLIRHLIAAGYRFQTVAEALKEPARKSVVLTINGGYRSQHTNLLPLLQTYKIKATCFVTDRGETDVRFLKPLELQDMVRSGVIELGGTLPEGTDLNDLEAVEKQVTSMRHWIAGVTGALPMAFAYPHGIEIEPLEAIVQKAGYHVALTEGRRPKAVEGNLFHLTRTPIPRDAKPWQAYLLATRGRYSLTSHYTLRKLIGRK